MLTVVFFRYRLSQVIEEDKTCISVRVISNLIHYADCNVAQ